MVTVYKYLIYDIFKYHNKDNGSFCLAYLLEVELCSGTVRSPAHYSKYVFPYTLFPLSHLHLPQFLASNNPDTFGLVTGNKKAASINAVKKYV